MAEGKRDQDWKDGEDAPGAARGCGWQFTDGRSGAMGKHETRARSPKNSPQFESDPQSSTGRGGTVAQTSGSNVEPAFSFHRGAGASPSASPPMDSLSVALCQTRRRFHAGWTAPTGRANPASFLPPVTVRRCPESRDGLGWRLLRPLAAQPKNTEGWGGAQDGSVLLLGRSSGRGADAREGSSAPLTAPPVALERRRLRRISGMFRRTVADWSAPRVYATMPTRA